jgi:hypothetical protein
VAQGVGPEFKPPPAQHHKKTKTNQQKTVFLEVVLRYRHLKLLICIAKSLCRAALPPTYKNTHFIIERVAFKNCLSVVFLEI